MSTWPKNLLLQRPPLQAGLDNIYFRRTSSAEIDKIWRKESVDCAGSSRHLPVQFPSYGPPVDVPPGHCSRQYICLEALREGPWRLNYAGRLSCRSRAAKVSLPGFRVKGYIVLQRIFQAKGRISLEPLTIPGVDHNAHANHND